MPDTIRNGVLSGRRKVKTWRLKEGGMAGAAERKEFKSGMDVQKEIGSSANSIKWLTSIRERWREQIKKVLSAQSTNMDIEY